MRNTGGSLQYVHDLDKELGIRGVRDACFLHGYGEPVLLVLYESQPSTWAARLNLRKDTLALAALSLNLEERRHTVIWRRDKLPHTCYRLVPLPSPLGGALVGRSKRRDPSTGGST